MSKFQKYLSLLTLFFTSSAFAVHSLNSTMSTGFYNDRLNKSHNTIYFDFQHHYLHSSGVESFLDLGINNNFLEGKWGAYPHQFYVNIPIDNGFKEAPYYKSRVVLGRQFLTEGFDFTIMDGAVLPYYFTPYFGLTLYGGSLHIMEEPQVKTDDKLYGGSFFIKGLNTIVKFGPSVRARETINRTVGHLSVMHEFSSVVFLPVLLAKTQYDFTNKLNDQSLAEAQFTFTEKLQASLISSSLKPDPVIAPDKKLIYKLVAIDEQKSNGGSINWEFASGSNLGFKSEIISYHSVLGLESGDLSELYGSKRWDSHKMSLFYSRINSFGGSLYQFGGDYAYEFDEFKELNLGACAANVDKINKIKAWLYNGKVGMTHTWKKQWKLLYSLEVERNHLFESNLKAIVYATHFYY